MFGRATITLGIGPHSSFSCFLCALILFKISKSITYLLTLASFICVITLTISAEKKLLSR